MGGVQCRCRRCMAVAKESLDDLDCILSVSLAKTKSPKKDTSWIFSTMDGFPIEKSGCGYKDT